VLESLKNVILVMHAAGMLVPPLAIEHGDSRDQQQRQLWDITHDKIERFMPGFMESVLPLSSATASSSIQPSTTIPVTGENSDSHAVAPDNVPPQTAVEQASIV
jgi:hypothetical protein